MPSEAPTDVKGFPFVSRRENLTDILVDRELAALGDAYVNFVYSLALSRKRGRPVGKKVDSSALASALKKAGLRRLLPSRSDRHRQADGAESLVVYAWLTGAISLDETVQIVEKEEMVEDAFALLLQAVLKRLNLPHQKV